jgi:negative regulator of sigma E activity
MTPDHSSLEAELRDLKAVGLDESFLTRLEASADGTWTGLTYQESRFEESLRKNSAAPLPADFMAELERIVAKNPFPTGVNIVPFPTVHTAAHVRCGARLPPWQSSARPPR